MLVKDLMRPKVGLKSLLTGWFITHFVLLKIFCGQSEESSLELLPRFSERYSG
jgi:hypothetical protein